MRQDFFFIFDILTQKSNKYQLKKSIKVGNKGNFKMVKQCPICKTENEDYNFWCKNCNKKLFTSNIVRREEEKIPEELNKSKIDNYEIYPKVNGNIRINKKLLVFVFVGIISIAMIAANVSFGATFNFSNINCKINEDFYFDGKYLNTSDGWCFTMTKLKDYTLDGIVLGLKTYKKSDSPYRPINIFSPIDLVIGIEDIKDNTDSYPYSITYCYRGYWLTYQNSNAANYEYMRLHMGNNHIIPHNEQVLNQLSNISIDDCIFIKGSLVNLYGTRGSEYYSWTSDTHIGNYACEIILVDELIITNTS